MAVAQDIKGYKKTKTSSLMELGKSSSKVEKKGMSLFDMMLKDVKVSKKTDLKVKQNSSKNTKATANNILDNLKNNTKDNLKNNNINNTQNIKDLKTKVSSNIDFLQKDNIVNKDKVKLDNNIDDKIKSFKENTKEELPTTKIEKKKGFLLDKLISEAKTLKIKENNKKVNKNNIKLSKDTRNLDIKEKDNIKLKNDKIIVKEKDIKQDKNVLLDKKTELKNQNSIIGSIKDLNIIDSDTDELIDIQKELQKARENLKKIKDREAKKEKNNKTFSQKDNIKNKVENKIAVKDDILSIDKKIDFNIKKSKESIEKENKTEFKDKSIDIDKQSVTKREALDIILDLDQEKLNQKIKEYNAKNNTKISTKELLDFIKDNKNTLEEDLEKIDYNDIKFNNKKVDILLDGVLDIKDNLDKKLKHDIELKLYKDVKIESENLLDRLSKESQAILDNSNIVNRDDIRDILDNIIKSKNILKERFNDIKIFKEVDDILSKAKNIDDIKKAANILDFNIKKMEISNEDKKQILNKQLNKQLENKKADIKESDKKDIQKIVQNTRDILAVKIGIKEKANLDIIDKNSILGTKVDTNKTEINSILKSSKELQNVKENLETITLKVSENDSFLRYKIGLAKERHSSFISDLSRQMYNNYKPPVTAFRIELVPSTLGYISILMKKSGDTININFTSSKKSTQDKLVDRRQDLKSNLRSIFDEEIDFVLSFDTDSNLDGQDNQREQQKDS